MFSMQEQLGHSHGYSSKSFLNPSLVKCIFKNYIGDAQLKCFIIFNFHLTFHDSVKPVSASSLGTLFHKF